MELPLYDLHCHSTASDGVLSPQELVSRASSRGIDVLAITDHDTVSGVLSLDINDNKKIKIIPGAEFTCQWNGRILHIVGLGIDLECKELHFYFQRLESLRKKRAEIISERLVKMGLPNLLNEAERVAAGGNIGRPHFARAMVQQGLVKNEQQAFKNYLGSGKKGDVKIEWPEMEETLDTINKSKGISVLAHPTKYKMTFTKIRSVIKDFVKLGGNALEVSYPGITMDHKNHLLRIAKENGLLISGGSDFHSPKHAWTDLGKFMPVGEVDNHVLGQLLE